MGPLYSYNVEMFKLLKSKGIPVEFDSTAGSGHVAATGAHLDALLKFISANFSAVTPVVGRIKGRSPLAAALTPRRACIWSLGNFSIPGSWRSSFKRVAVHSVLGGLLGYESIVGRRMIDGKALSSTYGETVLVIEPIIGK